MGIAVRVFCVGLCVRLHAVDSLAQERDMNFWLMTIGCVFFGIDMGFLAGLGLWLVVLALESEINGRG
jgi:hypothetical protein